MIKTSPLVPVLVLVSILIGCAPQDSLFPLFTLEDKVFDKQLLGEWKLKSKTDAKPDPSEKPVFVMFCPGATENAYDVKMKDGNPGGAMRSTARLVRLGEYIFIDLETPDTDEFQETPYPAIASHCFGRLVLSGDTVRMNFLSDDWVTQQVDAGKLGLSYVKGPDSTLLTADTAELRKFALEHAEDHEAFSESYILTRNK